MSFVKVKNVVNKKPPPDGSTSWLSFKRINRGQKPVKCGARNCYGHADTGGLVTKIDENKREYILPLCYPHSTMLEQVVFEVWEDELVLVS